MCVFQIFSQTTIKDLRKKSSLLTGYMELLLKQKFSKSPEADQPENKRPHLADRGTVMYKHTFMYCGLVH